MTQTLLAPWIHQFYAELEPYCLAGLRRTLNDRTHLYDRQLRSRRWEPTHGTEDLTSTCICLIGTDRAGIEPEGIGLDRERTLEATCDLAIRHKYDGGLGLLVWANAVCNGRPLNELLDRVHVSLDDPVQYVERLTTMESAWLLSGLLHEWKRSADTATEVLVEKVTAQLQRRYRSEQGVMAHAGPDAPLSHRLRKWVANFADQIYSVQAFSFAAKLTGDDRSLDAAETVAAKMVEHQGSLGQWWWHYDARTGDVAQRYSVYAVHQHGMAPMALAALHAAGGTDHSEAADLSRAWLTANELNLNLIDAEYETIWRDIQYRESTVKTLNRKVSSLLGKPLSDDGQVSLSVNYETRPYEWAWCLYAGAIETGKPTGRHIV